MHGSGPFSFGDPGVEEASFSLGSSYLVEEQSNWPGKHWSPHTKKLHVRSPMAPFPWRTAKPE